MRRNTPCPCHSRPSHDQRNTNPALVRPSLPSAQRQIRSGRASCIRKASVVGSKDDDGIFFEAQCGDLLEDPSNALVHILDHRGIRWLVLHLTDWTTQIRKKLRSFLIFKQSSLGLVFLFQSAFGLQRSVDGVVREIEKERLVAVLLYKSDRLIG